MRNIQESQKTQTWHNPRQAQKTSLSETTATKNQYIQSLKISSLQDDFFFFFFGSTLACGSSLAKGQTLPQQQLEPLQ